MFSTTAIGAAERVLVQFKLSGQLGSHRLPSTIITSVESPEEAADRAKRNVGSRTGNHDQQVRSAVIAPTLGAALDAHGFTVAHACAQERIGGWNGKRPDRCVTLISFMFERNVQDCDPSLSAVLLALCGGFYQQCVGYVHSDRRELHLLFTGLAQRPERRDEARADTLGIVRLIKARVLSNA
jgi:hypothetical protein